MKAIKDLVKPASEDELLRFSGLMNNYFSRFADHFANLSRPLYDFVKGAWFSKRCRLEMRLIIPNWKNRWGERQREGWCLLEDSLNYPEILAPSKPGSRKKGMADASAYGLGGVFLKKGITGDQYHLHVDRSRRRN